MTNDIEGIKNKRMPEGTGAILALADTIDSLCGLMLVGEKATSSSDPYGLRRATIRIIEICNYHGSPKSIRLINIIELVQRSLCIYHDQSRPSVIDSIEEPEKQILSFIEERAKNYFKKEFDIKLVNAIINFNIEPRLGLIRYNLIALEHFLSVKKGQTLLSCIKRINKILKNFNSEEEVDHELLEKPAKALHKELKKIKMTTHFHTDFIALTHLIPKIVKLFDNTMIIDQNPKITENNLRLLAQIRNLYKKVADFDCLL